ncbi:MAG: RNA polymerase sigma factor [Phycisphaerales bacterium]|nr:RNA polymerase sigma factor [Phycisphaerales bacterium]MCI0629510.1 RNA polymerase sigma factor [Phycisphaerales bacterium]
MRHGSAKARQTMYEHWVRDHGAELYGFAYRACGDCEVAEDLVQETFYEAWKCMNRLRDTERARAWLFQILRHRYSRWVRTERRSPAAGPLDAAALAAVSTGAEAAHLGERDSLQTALNGVSDALKIPLLMVFIEGLTCHETATRLDLPLGTVLSRIHRAKRQLRAILRESDAQDDAAQQTDTSRRYRIGGES